MKKNSFFKIFILIIILIIVLILFYLSKKLDEPVNISENNEVIEKEEVVENIEKEIVISDIDGNGINYEFVYNDEVFKVVYSPDNWKIYDSYKINNTKDMKKICQKLIDIYPIHGSDMISYRNSDDMVYEWLQHNLMYEVLPEDNIWKDNAKDVDFDPKDQGKSLKEIYEDRTGKKLDFDMSDK